MNPFDDLNANFSQDRLNSYLASRQAPKQQPAQQTRKPKSFLVDQISTVGGVLGGIGGGALGALAGGFGAVPGAAIGSGAGSALGETLENAFTGNNLGDNVLKEGALGTAFGAGPLKLLKFGGAGAAALTSGAKAAGKEGGEQVLKTSLAGQLTETGNKALASQYGTIGKNVAKETDPLNTIGKLADYGITKPQDAERIAHAVTGGNGLLNQAVVTAIGKSGKVNTSNAAKILQTNIDEFGLVDSDAKEVTQIVTAKLRSLGDTSATPQKTLEVMRNLESRIADYMGKNGNYKMSDPRRVEKARTLLAVKNELEDQLYNVAGANKNLSSVLTPELRESLIRLGPNNPQWQNYVDNTVMKAKDIGALRSAQSPFVKIGKIIDEGDINSLTFGGRVGNAFGGPGGFTGRALELAERVTKDPASRFIGNNLRDVGTGSALSAAPRGVLGAATNLGAISAFNNQGKTTPGTTDTQDMSMQQPMSLESALMGQTDQYGLADPMQMGMQEMQPQSQSPYSREGLMADIQRDPKNAQKYIELYQQYEEIFGAPQMEELSQSSRNALASSDSAINTVTQLEDLFTQAGGGSGRLGGKLKDLAGKAGADEGAAVYNSLANASVTQIAKALAGAGAGTVSDMDAKVIINALPRFDDTPAEARAKFNALKQRLQFARDTTMMYGGGADTTQPQGAF